MIQRSRVPRKIGQRIGLLLVLALAGCARTGDFGRPRAGFDNDTVLPMAGTLSAWMRGQPASFYAHTEAEKELRARAWHFLMPEDETSEPFFARDNLIADRVLPARNVDTALYHRTLMGGSALDGWVNNTPRLRRLLNPHAFRSLVSRYHRVRDDIAEDHQLIAPFEQAAQAVVQADTARHKAFGHVSDVTEEQRAQAQARICENGALIARVHWEYFDRAAQYRYALEHLLIEGPEPQAIAAERALLAFEAEIARFTASARRAGLYCPVQGIAPALPLVQKPRPLVRKG